MGLSRIYQKVFLLSLSTQKPGDIHVTAEIFPSQQIVCLLHLQKPTGNHPPLKYRPSTSLWAEIHQKYLYRWDQHHDLQSMDKHIDLPQFLQLSIPPRHLGPHLKNQWIYL